MKILFNTPNPALEGGPAKHLHLLAQSLERSVEVLPYEYGRKHDRESIVEKVLGRVVDLVRVRTLIRATGPDLVHHNSAFDARSILRDAPLVWLCRRLRVPLFIKVHGSHTESFGDLGPVMNLLRGYFVRNVTHLGVLSALEKGEFESAWPLLAGRVSVVKNIVKEEFFRCERREEATPTVLFLSRFIRKKGMFDLLRAVPDILRSVPGARFVFVGSGPDREAFRDEVHRMGLAAAVDLRPGVSNEEAVELYRGAWLLAFPTLFPEGMPMVVAEAMAAGVPVVTSRTRFALSSTRDGETAIFVEKGNPSSIATGVCRVLQDRGLREILSANGRALISRFDSRRVAEEFVALYESLAGVSARPALDVSPRQEA